MIKDIILIASGLLVAIIFTYVRGKIINSTKSVVEEKFQLSKFLGGMTNVISPVGWAKDIASLLNLRKLISYTVIIAILCGYSYFKGQQGKPVNFNLNYEKEFTLQLDGQKLHKPKNSNQLEILDEKGNRIKIISVKDISELQKKLRPYGFQLKPIAIAGLGIGTQNIKPEFGAGVSYLKYFKYNAEVFLTNVGIYPLAVSYTLDKLGEGNTAIGIGVGKGWKQGDTRIIGYFRWKF